jgi:hypothetical protein
MSLAAEGAVTPRRGHSKRPEADPSDTPLTVIVILSEATEEHNTKWRLQPKNFRMFKNVKC